MYENETNHSLEQKPLTRSPSTVIDIEHKHFMYFNSGPWFVIALNHVEECEL